MLGYKMEGKCGFVFELWEAAAGFSVSYCMQLCIVSQGVHGLDRELKKL